MSQVGIERAEMKKLVFNLEFHPWCPEFTIAGYRFVRVNDYDEQVRKLQHLVGSYTEFNINPNSGEHAITAHVILPNTQEKAILEWAEDSTALSDVLLLVSMFTSTLSIFLGLYIPDSRVAEIRLINR